MNPKLIAELTEYCILFIEKGNLSRQLIRKSSTSPESRGVAPQKWEDRTLGQIREVSAAGR